MSQQRQAPLPRQEFQEWLENAAAPVLVLQKGKHVLKQILRSRRGEGYIDVCVLVLCAMLVIALAVQVLPAFM